jgi:2,3-dihydro-2,3-dihydroxybenzoate dehydrogenase
VDGNGIAGRVALVTGAAQGIGLAVARALTAQRAHVALVDLDGERAGKNARDLPDAHGYTADVTCPHTVERLVTRVEDEMGPVDICVNVAGILRTGPVLETSDADWAALFAVNTTGVFNVSRAVSRRMVPRGRGAVVTVASNAAGVPRYGMAAYAASKAAAVMFTKSLGLELAAHGIRCNVVAPGSTDTPMQRAMWRDDTGADAVIEGFPAQYKVGIPLRRIADAADVAEAVVFLASERARHITMHNLYVDGGAALGA